MTSLKQEAHNLIGHSIRRNDGLEKVTGQAHFAADLMLPGTLCARLVVSPYAHALITEIDTSAALAVPGVVRVVTARDLPIKPAETDSRERNPLASNEVVFYGQPVAVVLGESEAAALDGVAAITVKYAPQPVVANVTEALKPGAPLTRLPKNPETIEKFGPNISNRVEYKQGDIDQGFEEAEVIVENTYRLPMVHQSYLETQSCTVTPDPLGGLLVYASTQSLFGTRKAVAQALGLPLNKVKVVLPPIGGGFGGKVVLLEPLCAALAVLTKRPVKLTFYRMEDLAAANPAPDSAIEIKMGATRSGILTALQARIIFDTGAYSGSPLEIAGLSMTLKYRIPNYEIAGLEVMTNRAGAGSYRAPGSVQTTFVIESQMDILARQLGIDPLQLRLQNSQVLDASLPEVMKKLANTGLWQEYSNSPRQPNEGFGLAVSGHSATLGPASAACRLNDDGTFTVSSGLADISGANTSLGLIAAEVLGAASTDEVTVISADSDSAPHIGSTGGSQTIYMLGRAVKKAAEDAREQLKMIAADQLEANVDDLEIEDSKIFVKGLANRAVSFKEIAEASLTDYEGKYAPVYGSASNSQSTTEQGAFAHLVKVKVDPETGEVFVLDYLVVQDVGFAINPAEIEGQIHGGVVQGLGWALYEQLVYDENGALISGSLMDYALQDALMVPPKIQVELVEVPSKEGPFGAKGVGEHPVVPVAAAITNAIFDAVGVRILEIPATPERVRSQILQNSAGN